ncbi:MAG: hypothetical protein OXM56_06205, partial [Gammaproteobacteria bacterium]|nr:hypothetical protein [Gammaproteobacteria bacterium]
MTQLGQHGHVGASRRQFLAGAASWATLAATSGRAASQEEAGSSGGDLGGHPSGRLVVTAVDAYPVYINERSVGLFDAPTFSSDDDPRRWYYGGPFEQLPSAIIAVVKT